LAIELGTTERTLRRFADTGTLRVSRRGRGHRHTAPGEEDYLRRHWRLLSALRSVLRTERRVRTAIVFGSVARGDDRTESDVDLLVDYEGESSLTERRLLKNRLASGLGRKVDLFFLDDLASQPAILKSIIPEARPVIDRDFRWRRLAGTSGRRELGTRQRRAGGP
jgi:predicted nucleotidyltransferase